MPPTPIVECVHPGNDVFAVVGIEKVLGSTFPEHGRGVRYQNLSLLRGKLRPTEDDNRGREPCAIEDVRAQPNDYFDEIALQEVLPNGALGTLPEERALRKHNRHAARACRPYGPKTRSWG